MLCKNNIRMGDLYAPDHVVPSLHIDPAGHGGLAGWGIYDLSLESSINGRERQSQECNQNQGGSEAAEHSGNTMQFSDDRMTQ